MQRDGWTANQQSSESTLPFLCHLSKAIFVKTMLFYISCCLKNIYASEMEHQEDNQNIKGLLILKTTRWNGVFLFPIENVHFRLHMFQTAVQDEFAIFQQLKFLKRLSIFENDCSVKSVSVQNSFCSLQHLPKHVVQTNENKGNCLKSSLLFLCGITHIFWNWKELSQLTS